MPDDGEEGWPLTWTTGGPQPRQLGLDGDPAHPGAARGDQPSGPPRSALPPPCASFTSGVVQCAVPGLAGRSSATVTVRTTVTAAKGSFVVDGLSHLYLWDPVTTNNGANATVSINNGK